MIRTGTLETCERLEGLSTAVYGNGYSLTARPELSSLIEFELFEADGYSLGTYQLSNEYIARQDAIEVLKEVWMNIVLENRRGPLVIPWFV